MSRDDGPPVAPAGLRVVALDADDTLWHSEGVFVEAQSTLVEILAPWTPEGIDPLRHNDGTERRNLELFGYGIKGFTLSMVETALEVSDGKVSAGAVARLIDLGKEMLAHPVELASVNLNDRARRGSGCATTCTGAPASPAVPSAHTTTFVTLS